MSRITDLALAADSDDDADEQIELSRLLHRGARKHSAVGSQFTASDEITEDEIIDNFLNRTMWDDFLQALYDVRLTAPLFAFMGIFLAYHLTISPYQTHTAERSRMQMEDLSKIRPILTEDTLLTLQRITLRAETSFVLPAGHQGQSEQWVSIRFHDSVSKNGNRELPEMFYHGVMFGLTTQNSHWLQYGYQSQPPPLFDLKQDLLTMQPRPTYVLDRMATCNNTDWREDGYGLYFSYDDLQRQGKLSSDVLQPWKRITDDVLNVARKYKQVYVTVWYPHEFGSPDNSSTVTMSRSTGQPVNPRVLSSRNTTQRYRYTSILQQVIPTRTGMNSLRSTAAVWMSSINGSAPEPLVPVYAYEKPWNGSEPWMNHSGPSTLTGESSDDDLALLLRQIY